MEFTVKVGCMKVEAPPPQDLAIVHVILSIVSFLYICLYVVDLLNCSSPTGPWVDTGCHRNSTRNPGGVKGSRHIRLTTLLPYVSWLSRRCGSLDISQSYGPPQPIIGIAFSFFFFTVA
jgi:hypothetical protein